MPTVVTQTQILDRDEIQRFLPDKSFRLVKFFENLAEDVSTNIPTAISESIQGPGSSTDNNIPVFDGTSGTKVRDSGVDIDSLAPLDSPTFTGIPKAPTPSPGDSTTQIATTGFVQTETANAVDGPASAVDNRVATFNGITGKLIKDSGVLISALAPLASPALTGNPTAPTPALGDNDTSIATTAYVQTELANGASTFSVHNNGVAQSIPNNTQTKLTFSTEVFDTGNNFSGSTWTPPAGRPIILNGHMTIPTAANLTSYVTIYKNGAEFKRGTQMVAPTASNEGVHVTVIDIPNGTDTYELWAFQNTGAAQNTNGDVRLTYFQGTTIRP